MIFIRIDFQTFFSSHKYCEVILYFGQTNDDDDDDDDDDNQTRFSCNIKSKIG